jgi:serine phosphatase RsbU (regulator of sigma subunit)
MNQQNFLFKIAKRLWPELGTFTEQRQVVGTGNVFFFVYTFPLTVITTVWLLQLSDWLLVRENWLMLLILAGLMLLFSKLNFFSIVEIHPGTYANADSSLSGAVLWSGLLLFGPTILWLPWLGKLAELLWQFARATSTASRWVYLRVFTLYNAGVIGSALVSIWAYDRLLGGSLPLAGLGFREILPAFLAVMLQSVLFGAVYSGFIIYIVWAQSILTTVQSRRRILFFLVVVLGLPYLAYPFGIFGAGIYAQNDLFSYLFFMAGMCIVALLARQLSRMAESSRQQSRQLEQLELLSRDIINGPPDASELPDYLARHVPVMFPSGRVIAWVEPGNFLLRHPLTWHPGVERFWGWFREQPETRAFEADAALPWRTDFESHSPVVVAAIREVETGSPIGVIYIELQTLVQPWNERTLQSLFPAVNALAAQVASALRQAAVYEEALSLSRTAQELEFASEIQASFLPDKIPILPGWELAVTILPAREMAGDFFDFIPLENGNLGILIADVTDKGVGPALYMALSRTLIRTYAIEYEFDPDTVFFAANRRILRDARASLFVTAFFGVLDQQTGILTYSNAGHNPPYLLRAQSGEIEALHVTGMPVGVEEHAIWDQEKIQLEPGDVLLLYTDGIPDAVNEDGEFFDDDNLLEVAQLNSDTPAHEIQAAIIEQLHQFSGDTPQVDDITLMVLKRDPLPVDEPTPEGEMTPG